MFGNYALPSVVPIIRSSIGLRNTMIKFKLGYRGYAMGMVYGKAKNKYPEANKAFE